MTLALILQFLFSGFALLFVGIAYLLYSHRERWLSATVGFAALTCAAMVFLIPFLFTGIGGTQVEL